MVSRTTHTYKTVGPLKIDLDIYIADVEDIKKTYDSNQPVVLFFHGGGIVAHTRRLLHPHIVQSCVLRGWPLVSADYRLLPQATGKEIFEDVKDAYAFVHEKLLSILNGKDETAPLQNIILVGQSAGTYLSFQGGHFLEPRPLALLVYYGSPTFNDDMLRSNMVLTDSPMTLSQVQHWLDEPVSTGFTPLEWQFDNTSLLPGGGKNPEWKRGEYEGEMLRDNLVFWLLQNNTYPELLKDVDRGWDDEGWKNYPPVVIVHGDADEMVPLQCAYQTVDIIGPTTPKLFVVPGVGHAWDTGFLGDPSLKEVEEAWKALHEIVESSIGENLESR